MGCVFLSGLRSFVGYGCVALLYFFSCWGLFNFDIES